MKAVDGLADKTMHFPSDHNWHLFSYSINIHLFPIPSYPPFSTMVLHPSKMVILLLLLLCICYFLIIYSPIFWCNWFCLFLITIFFQHSINKQKNVHFSLVKRWKTFYLQFGLLSFTSLSLSLTLCILNDALPKGEIPVCQES